MAEKIEITKDGYLELIRKVLDNKQEEREFALDRYRKADGEMQSPEQFAILGKNAVEFLKLASSSSNDIAAIAKEIKSIVYKDALTEDDIQINMSDSMKNAIQEKIEEAERKKKKNIITPTDNLEEK